MYCSSFNYVSCCIWLSGLLPLTSRQGYIYSCYFTKYSGCSVCLWLCVYLQQLSLYRPPRSLCLAIEILGNRFPIHGKEDHVRNYIKEAGCKVHQIRQAAFKNADEAGKCHCKAEFLSLRGDNNQGRLQLTRKKKNGSPIFKNRLLANYRLDSLMSPKPWNSLSKFL